MAIYVTNIFLRCPNTYLTAVYENLQPVCYLPTNIRLNSQVVFLCLCSLIYFLGYTIVKQCVPFTENDTYKAVKERGKTNIMSTK